MKNKKDKCNFDDTLREKFSSFEKVPNASIFDHISQELKDQAFDNKVTAKLKDFSATPDEQVWNKVKIKLPLHLQLKRTLQKLSKVAAVSVAFMTTLYFAQQETASSIVAPIVHNASSYIDTLPTQSLDVNDYVFAIEAKSEIEEEIEKRVNKVASKRSKKKNAADFISFILEEEKGIEGKLDLTTLKEALLPIESLSPKYLSAKILKPLPKTKSQYVTSNTFVLDVTIPMQIAEPDEIESLLELYDNRAFE